MIALQTTNNKQIKQIENEKKGRERQSRVRGKKTGIMGGKNETGGENEDYVKDYKH